MLTQQSRLALAAIAEEGATLAEIRLAYIDAVLARHGGIKARAAQTLGLSVLTVYRRAREIEAYAEAARFQAEVDAAYNWVPNTNGAAASRRKEVAAC